VVINLALTGCGRVLVLLITACKQVYHSEAFTFALSCTSACSY